MIIITKYIADDGKEFEDEDECLDYEQRMSLKRIESQVRLFDHEGKQIPLEKGITDAFFIGVATDSAARIFDDFCKYGGTPWGDYEKPEAGRWYFDEDLERWDSVKNLYDKVEKVKKVFGQPKETEILPF